MALLVAVVGGCTWSLQSLETYGFVARLGIGAVAGFAAVTAVFFGTWGVVHVADKRRHARAIEAADAAYATAVGEAEAEFREHVADAGSEHLRRVADVEKWKADHPSIQRLLDAWARAATLDSENPQELEEFRRIAFFAAMSPDLRKACETAIREDGTKQERDMFLRLRKEVLARMSDEEREGSEPIG